MIFYWAMFAIPALVSFSVLRLEPRLRSIVLAATAALLVVIVGLRDQVGADWDSYADLFQFNQGPIAAVLLRKEAGFGLLNWLGGQLHFGQIGVDVVCAAIFAGGFLAFYRDHESFYLALTLATPTLVIGVAMSAERQSAAIGFMMFALKAFQKQKSAQYLSLILLGALFHQTVAIFAVYVIFIRGNIRLVPLILSVSFFVLVGIFVIKDADFYSHTYVEQDQGGAAGALPRVVMTGMAAIFYLLLRKRWAEAYGPSTAYTLMALTAVTLAPGVLYAQIATDRMLQYLLPFQISVFARLPYLMTGRVRLIVSGCVITVYALSLAVWLNFSWIAQLGWVPYHSVLFKVTGG